MKKALLILFGGLDNTVVHSQVATHSREMFEQGIIDFEIWSFVWSKRMLVKSQNMIGVVKKLSQCNVRVFKCVRPAMPFSLMLNALIISRLKRKLSPDIRLIHARADYSSAVCARMNLFFKTSFIWDCRGDAESEFLHRAGNSKSVIYRLFLKYQAASKRKHARLAAIGCDKAMFVTKELRDSVGNEIEDKQFAIIPCVASERMFYYSKELRNETRDKYCFSENDIVIVYCGNTQKYQCYEESIDLFKKLRHKNNNVKLLIVTPELHTALEPLMSLPEESYILTSSAFDETNAILNAADYGLLIRENIQLNRVASPVKFAEYSLAGLPVIMSDSVPSSYEIAKNIGNLCEYKNGEIRLMQVYDRQAVANKYKEVLSKSAYLNIYKEIYGN